MITTRSAFVYVSEITTLNNTISLDEGTGDFSVSITSKTYSLTDLLSAVSAALNAGSGAGITYTVTIDRSTRFVTIAGDASFDLNFLSGGASLASTLGFAAVDLTGASSYTGTSAAGSAYFPQFRLQGFVDFDDDQASNQAAVNESATGVTEVVKFGDRNLMSADIQYANDKTHPLGDEITTNNTGVADLRSFMRFAITKGDMEFVPDITSASSFTKCILESTPESRTGTRYVLKEQFARGLGTYFNTGRLVFRKVV